jgi:hypothetical protein
MSGERGSVKQYIQNNIGVNKYFHLRCLASLSSRICSRVISPTSERIPKRESDIGVGCERVPKSASECGVALFFAPLVTLSASRSVPPVRNRSKGKNGLPWRHFEHNPAVSRYVYGLCNGHMVNKA